MSNVISRVFMNGNSQAVRIPQEFRLEASRVRISRNEEGDLIIHPLAADRGAALLEALQAFDDPLSQEFASQIEADRRAQPAVQKRDSL